MSKYYSQLTYEDRITIKVYKQAGNSNQAIADKLGRSPSTISREIKRNTGQRGYRPKQAQEAARQRQLQPRTLKMTAITQKHIRRQLQIEWSPEQIAHTMKTDPGFTGRPVSTETIYRFIWKDKKQGGNLHLKLRLANNKKKRKRRHGKDNRGKIINRKDIDLRPAIVQTRSRLGDWEADLVVGKGQQGYLVTLAERSARRTLIGYVKQKTAESVTDEIIRLLQPWQDFVHTITFDNGKEFAGHEIIAQRLNCSCFFAKPYHSWERGLNENTNGLIRQYFPKKMSLHKVQPDKLQFVMDRLNQRPRKCLGFQTPNQVFHMMQQTA
jgi:transposase, IS30 family